MHAVTVPDWRASRDHPVARISWFSRDSYVGTRFLNHTLGGLGHPLEVQVLEHDGVRPVSQTTAGVMGVVDPDPLALQLAQFPGRPLPGYRWSVLRIQPQQAILVLLGLGHGHCVANVTIPPGIAVALSAGCARSGAGGLANPPSATGRGPTSICSRCSQIRIWRR